MSENRCKCGQEIEVIIGSPPFGFKSCGENVWEGCKDCYELESKEW